MRRLHMGRTSEYSRRRRMNEKEQYDKMNIFEQTANRLGKSFNAKEQWDIDDLERYIKDVEHKYEKEIEELKDRVRDLELWRERDE